MERRSLTDDKEAIAHKIAALIAVDKVECIALVHQLILCEECLQAESTE